MKKQKIMFLVVAVCTLFIGGCGAIHEKTTINSVSNTSKTSENSESVEDTNIDKSNEFIENTPTIEVTPTSVPTPIERDDTITISMVGDNLIHSPIYKNAKQEDETYDFSSLFENVKEDITSADISIINQETIFVSDYSLISSYPCFGTPSEMGKYIVDAGFDIVACATNHTYDKKETGITQTIEYWNANYPNITYLGIHKDEEDANTIKTYESKGVTFSFVNYTYGLNGFVLPKEKPYLVDLLDNQEKYINDLQKANEIGDITICILHAGNEYVYAPTTYQKEMIDIAIDNGADIVFCSHPHVLEPYDMITTSNGNTGLVFYSLGNFISNQDSMPKLLGGLANVELNVHYIDDEVSSVEIGDYNLTPLVTHYNYEGYYTTYKLNDYTNELASKHKRAGLSVEKLNELFDKIMATPY